MQAKESTPKEEPSIRGGWGMGWGREEDWFVLGEMVSCFYRNKIHIQAFVDFINGKLMSGHSSSSIFMISRIHHFII